MLDRLTPRAGRRVFTINLSARYRPSVEPARLALMTLCGLILVGTLWDCGRVVMIHREISTLRAELMRVRQQDAQLIAEAAREGIDLSEAALRRLPTEVALANQLLEKRMFSWTKFLTGLEQAIPPRLALSSVRLDTGGTNVHLVGTAVTLEDITAFTVGLQDHPIFKDPVLAQHRVASNGLVEFEVRLRYRREGV